MKKIADTVNSQMLALLLAGCAVMAWPAGALAQDAGKPQRLNQRSWSCGQPVIAAGPEGRVCAVWDGYDQNGRRHIWFTQLSEVGVWAPEVAISVSIDGPANDPDLAIDAEGHPHVVWTSLVDGRLQVFYSHRSRPLDETGFDSGAPTRSDDLLDQFPPLPDLSETPASPPAGWSAPVRLDAVNDLNSETPSIVIDPMGRRIVIWQSGLGVVSGIYAATAMADGAWRVDLLSEPDATYCFSPQLTGNAPPLALWYAADDTGFHFRAALPPTSPERTWRPVDTAALGARADRPVALVPDGMGGLLALWVSEGDGSPERIHMTRPTADGTLQGVIMDDRPEALNREPVADVDPGRAIALAWVAEAEGRGQVMARLITAEVTGPGRTLSPADDIYVVSPDACLDGRGAFHIVWRSDHAIGGTGHIWHSALSAR